MTIEQQKNEIVTLLARIKKVPFPTELENEPDSAELLPASAFASAQRFLNSETIRDFAESYEGFNGFTDTVAFLSYTLENFDNAIGRFSDNANEYLKLYKEILLLLVTYLEESDYV